MNNVVLAIFKRNFAGYLSNPTGYVFICVFVLLSSLAAFWPNEFFTSNLANLDQLNKQFPLIMLIFVPAITMSIWAEERRQGTDELLLTIPATDADVVIGKYLAAVGIFGVSLLFSLICNYIVLAQLGTPDIGLLACTYIGYFMVGLAMLSIGMVASFLTNNITVGFVLGALFNSVPVGLAYVDVIAPTDWAAQISRFSIAEQLRDFTLGVVSLSSMAYFLLIVAAMLYASMVLIGRRHWQGGRDGRSLGLHYIVRLLGLGIGAVGIFLLGQWLAVRKDMSDEGLTTLADATKNLVSHLDQNRPIKIEAFVSSDVPQDFVPVRLDLINRLHEIKAQGGANVSLTITDTEPFTEEADRAERAYGITAQSVRTTVRNQRVDKSIFMGVVVRAGLDKIVIPFVSPSTPIEYEIVRSIATLNGGKRKRLGIFVLDQTMDFRTQQPMEVFREVQESASGQPQLVEPEIVTELKKQYDVEMLDINKPVPDNVDVMMVVQPTLLQPEQMEHLLQAVRRGVPSLILQDPEPVSFPTINQAAQMLRADSPEVQMEATKDLWELLGVNMPMGQVVQQSYVPRKDMEGQYPDQFVFIDNGAILKGAGQSLFDETDPISRGTQQLVFLFCGSISKNDEVKRSFTPLVRTGTVSGITTVQDRSGKMQAKTGVNYTLAAHIKGTAAPMPVPTVTPTATTTAAPTATATATAAPTSTATATASATPSSTASPTASATATAAAPAKPAELNVVLIADLDLMGQQFFSLRSQRVDDDRRFFNFDNVTFVLNSIDVLAGDDRFVETRKRRSKHRTLEVLDAKYQQAADQIKSAEDQFTKKREGDLDRYRQELDDIERKLQEDKSLKEIDRLGQEQILKRRRAEQVRRKEQELAVNYERLLKDKQRELNEDIRRTQDFYKACAVFIPPIFPLLVGLGVFFNRRAAEQEGVSKSRLK